MAKEKTASEQYAIRECGFGGPASMICPVHKNAKIVRTASKAEAYAMESARIADRHPGDDSFPESMDLGRDLNVPDIAYLPATMRKEIYDRLDPDRAIATKVWNGSFMTVAERFIAYSLGYLIKRKVPR